MYKVYLKPGKEESLKTILPIAKKYGAVVVGLALDENGIPETSEGRVEIAKKIISRCEEAGIPRADIAIDCLTMTVGVDSENPRITLSALEEVKKLGAKTVLGVSNVSFGLPRRDIVNRTFLAAALNRGLDLAIINPGDTAMIETMAASRLLSGFDEGGAEYIEKFSQSVAEKIPQGSAYSLSDAVERGLCDEAAAAMKTLLRTEDAQNVINTELIPILDNIGKRYEDGKIYLPQLMRSAEAARAACDVVRAALPAAENGSEIFRPTRCSGRSHTFTWSVTMPTIPMRKPFSRTWICHGKRTAPSLFNAFWQTQRASSALRYVAK